MARKPMTEAQKKARVAKAKATREANKKKSLELLGLQQYDRSKKPRKKRVMSEEQKQAAVDRLAKAREAKAAPAQLSVDESIRNLPDTDSFAPPRVRGWIKNVSMQLKSMRSMKTSNDAKDRAQYNELETYLANLQTYLRTGIYLDNRWGSERQHKVTPVCRVMAYYPDGTPKRNIGTWYPDIGCVYTEEMAKENA